MSELIKLGRIQIKNAPRFASLAFGVFVISEFFSILILRCTEGKPYFTFALWILIKTLLLWWVLPLLVVIKIEKRNVQSLGLIIPCNRLAPYGIIAAPALILPIFIFGYAPYYPIEFLEQMLYIGFAEEVFYRRYMMTRMCQWLGKWRGLLIFSLIFGLGHIIFRLADHGIGYLIPALFTGLQTFFGGIIFGMIYLRAKNIYPGAILHVASNMYLSF